MPKKPIGITDEQMNVYEKYNGFRDVLKTIMNDYSLPDNICELASTLSNNYFDITNQDAVNLLTKRNPQTGEFESLGMEAVKDLTRDNVLNFVKQLDDYITKASKDAPVYNFHFVTKDNLRNQIMYKSNNFLQGTGEYLEGEYSKYPEQKKQYLESNKAAIEKFKAERKAYEDVLAAIKNQRTFEEVLEQEAVTETHHRQCIEVSAGRSNVVLGRHVNYTNLSETALDSYEGIPMGGLALLVANSLNINRNLLDASSQFVQHFEPEKELNAEESAIIKDAEKNIEYVNVGAKILDSLYNGADVVRMGDRAEAVVKSRVALNEAMAKYQSGEKKPLADLMADSFETVYSQIFYCGDKNLGKQGVKAMSEIYKACSTMFEKDPELQTMCGISAEQMQVMKGASISYDQIADPNNRLLEAYRHDKGPNTPEREECLDNLLFSTYLESSIATEVELNRENQMKIAAAKVNTPFYANLLEKYPEESSYMVKDAMQGKLAYDIKKMPSAFELLGVKGMSVSALKATVLEGLKKMPEYKEYLNMSKDELYQVNLAKFTKSVVKKQLSEKKFIKTVDANNVWQEIQNDYTLPAETAELAHEFEQLKLNISNQSEINMLTQMNPKTGKLEPLPIIAAESVTKESALKFIQSVQSHLKGSDCPIYNFGSYENRFKRITMMYKGDGTKLQFENTRLDEPLPEQPEVVAKPGGFKLTTNKWFGWFKNDIQEYNNYVKATDIYNNAVRMKSEIQSVFNKNQKQINANIEFDDFYRKKFDKLNESKSIETRLKEAAAEEKKRDQCVEVSSGRSDKLLGRHKNYEDLRDIKLKDLPGMPMEGLALLASVSLKLNRNVADSSTALAQSFHPTQPLNQFEQDYLKQAVRDVEITNVSSKIVESLYGGTDISRMGDRATAVVAGRKAVNDAAEKYLTGDEQPLADLINDSIDVLYHNANELCTKSNTAQGKALSEMYKALEKVFAQDPEFRKMINISDEKLNVIKGASKVLDIIKDPRQQLVDAYAKDAGPGTDARKEALEELLFKRCLHSAVVRDAAKNNEEAEQIFASEIAAPKYAQLFGKFEGREMASVQAATMACCQSKNKKPSALLTSISNDKLGMNAVKESMLDDIRKSPVYNELLGMDKNKLYMLDFDTIAGKIIDDNLAKQKNQLNLEIEKQHDLEKAPEKEAVQINAPN